LPPNASAIQARTITRQGVGKPVVLLALLCAILMPLSNPVASNAFSDVAVSIHDVLPDDPVAHGVFIQQQIVHLATHPRAGVPFLTAFLTEAERLCQPHAHNWPGFPTPNAAATSLLEASSIALPPVWAFAASAVAISIGANAFGWSDGREPPPDPPPPKAAG
jgi:hypothetical protein